MKKCIIVIGMHRSGTSAFMGVLNILGIDLGSNYLNPSEDNPKGFFENISITQINEKILQSLNSSWDDVFFLPENWWNSEHLLPYRQEIIEIIKHEFHEKTIFGIKDPRISRLLPLWKAIFKELSIEPHYIIPLRNPLEVAKSLRTRNGFAREKSLLLWMKYMLDAELYSRGRPRVFVSFDELLRDPEKTVNKISTTLSIGFSKDYRDVKDDVGRFLEHGLKHHSIDMSSDVLEMIGDLYYSLLELSRCENPDGEQSEKIDAVREKFLRTHRHFYNSDIICGKDTLIESLKSTIRDKETEKGNVEAVLSEIYNSRGWKVLLKYYKAREFILPSGSRRDFISKILIRVLTSPGRLLQNIDRHNIGRFFYCLKAGDLSTLEKKIEIRLNLSSEFKPLRVELFNNVDKKKITFKKVAHPLVSIVIPVYNNWEHTYSCLLSIVENTKDIPYEIIVADDVSSDETKNIGAHVEGVKVVRNRENQGFLQNCNNASKEAEGKYILFLNNDTRVQKDWLKHLVDLMEKNASIGMVGPKLVYQNGMLQEAGGIIWEDASGWNYGRLDNPNKPEYNYIKEVDYISGACIMIKKDIWTEIGGFDERYAPAYCEDSDLAFEVRRHGYKVVYQPLSVVVHLEGVSHGTNINDGIKSKQAENKMKLFGKWKDVLEKEHYEGGQHLFKARDRSRFKKTILVIDHYVPEYDKSAGSKTIFQYLRLFVESGLNVKFIGDNFSNAEPYTTALGQLGVEVLYGRWYRNNWKRWIKSNSTYFDYIFLNRPYIAIKYIDFIKKNTKAKIIYYGHDLHFLRELRRFELEGKKEFLHASKKFKKMEFEIFSKSDVVYYPSEVEIREIRRYFPDIAARSIPGYIYDKFEEVDDSFASFETRDGLLFVGGFLHTPNIDAVLWFAKEIFPKVVMKLPWLKLYVVGSHPPDAVKKLESDNIEVSGFVSDDELRNYYRKCRLAIVPLRYGAGVKGKVVEALYYGMPVITTATGAEGLEGSDGILTIADDAEDFASKIIDFYNDFESMREFSRKSRDYVKNRFTKESALKAIYNDIYK